MSTKTKNKTGRIPCFTAYRKTMLSDKLTDARKGQADEEQALVAVCRYSRAAALK
ncbi:MAG: hypothetical protein Q8865_00185 [Bacillota bacterium]|nr:hypothetical protein [Bacillota bacterium]